MDDLFVKAATIIAVALASFSSFPGTAQQQETPAQAPATQQSVPSSNPGTGSQPRTGVSQPPSAAAAQLQPVRGELVTKLDSKSAKQGDSVVVKTEDNVTFPGGAQIPKGSKLVGHVTNVQARGEGKENSQIAIQFDRAEVKDGQNIAIESVIQSVAPAAGDESNGAPLSGGATGSAANGSTGSMTGTANPSATPNGSNQSGMSDSRPNPGSNPGSNTTAQQGMTDPATNPGSQSANANMPAPGSIIARNGNVAIRATAVPGVLLANNIDGLPFTNASGIVLGARRDVHLDNGTQLVLAVAAAPQGSGGMNR